jgi:hypothetical protein
MSNSRLLSLPRELRDLIYKHLTHKATLVDDYMRAQGMRVTMDEAPISSVLRAH